MYNAHMDPRLIALNRETDMMNTFVRHWAALSNIQKIDAAIDLNQQISGLSYQLSLLPITPISNRPHFVYNINWDLFPKEQADLVTRISAAMGWDPTIILIAMLSGVAMATCGVFKITVRPGWIEQLLLYTMLIAESGAGKSRLFNMIKGPMNTAMDEKRSRYDQTAGRQAFVARAQAKIINKAHHANQAMRIQAELKSEGRCDYNKLVQLVGEEAASAYDALEQVEGTGPTFRPNHFISSGTSKGILAALIQNHGHQAICEPEGGLILNIARDTRFDLDVLLKPYGGESHQYTTSHGIASLSRPRLNILYGVQPEVAVKFFGNTNLVECGLTSRFIPVFPILHERQNIEVTGLDIHDQIIRHLLDTCYDQNQAGTIRVLKLDKEAEYMVASFESELERWISSDLDSRSSFVKKLPGTACRLAGAMHLWRTPQNPDKTPISGQTMTCGIELARASMPPADYVYNPRGLKS